MRPDVYSKSSYGLQPCPCCGGPGRLKDVHNRIRQGWVGCPVCGLYIGWKIDPAGAIRKWNQRAMAPDSMIVALTPTAINLLKYMPEAVNALAATLTTKINELILYGDQESEGRP